MRKQLMVLIFACLALVACQSEPAAPAPAQSGGGEAQVEAAIKAYLASRSDLAMSNMDVEFKKIEIQGDAADADVVFRVKAGEGEMAMHYKLAREDGRWVVQRSRPDASQSQMPPGHPPIRPESPERAH